MKKIILALCIQLTLGSSLLAASYPAKFKGPAKIETILSVRIGNSDGSFDLGIYLGVPQNARSGSLLGLLGTISNGTFKNGDPNGINFLLWYLTLEAFTNELLTTCQGQSPSGLSDEFRSLLSSLCLAEDWRTEKTQEDLAKIWTELMSYEAPNTEQIKWVEAVTQFAGETQNERMKFSLMLIFMNPYFLLEE